MRRRLGGSSGKGSLVNVGSLVKRYRRMHGMTQRELACIARVSVGALRDIEQGRTVHPRWELVHSLFGVLGLDEGQLAQPVRAQSRGERVRAVSMAGDGCRGAAAAHGVSIHVLGRLEAQRHGMPVALGSVRQQSVLGLLALEHDAGVHQDVIIEALWGDTPPKSAAAMVHGYIWRLRTILRSESERCGCGVLIATEGSRYRLDVTHEQLDLAAFLRLIRLARQAEVKGELVDARELYEKALVLWQGEVLADVDMLHDYPALIELTRAHADAVVRYAELASTAGASHMAMPHLRSLCRRDRFNEHAHAQLMTALAANGQLAAALDVYRRIRHRLRSELGIEPSSRLSAIHASILRQCVAGS
jgi:DNA-binding SARP family transcriptional activator/DNA-binding XRE family transcriptional regulator